MRHKKEHFITVNSNDKWYYTKNEEILIQKRAKDKDTYPDLWDISVAGHMETGETPEKAAIREINEEIGLTIKKEDLEYIGTLLSEKQPKSNLFDNEFNHIYLSEFKTSIKTLKIQEEEVSDIKLLPIQYLKKDLQDDFRKEKYVPHSIKYYNFILTAIINRLT